MRIFRVSVQFLAWTQKDFVLAPVFGLRGQVGANRTSWLWFSSGTHLLIKNKMFCLGGQRSPLVLHIYYHPGAEQKGGIGNILSLSMF